MAAARPQTIRHGLHLSISASVHNYHNTSDSPDSISPSSSTALSSTPAGTTPTTSSDSSELVHIWALCMHDFDSRDTDHLPFKKNQIIEIVKQEDSGWWAAVSLDGRRIGWVPKAYLRQLTPEMTEKLRSVRPELRVFEYEAEQLYNSAPISHLHHLYDFEPSPRSPRDTTRVSRQLFLTATFNDSFFVSP